MEFRIAKRPLAKWVDLVISHRPGGEALDHVVVALQFRRNAVAEMGAKPCPCGDRRVDVGIRQIGVTERNLGAGFENTADHVRASRPLRVMRSLSSGGP